MRNLDGIYSLDGTADKKIGVDSLMPRIIDFDLPESLEHTMKAYVAKTRDNSQDYSHVVEAALMEFFEKRGVRVDT